MVKLGLPVLSFQSSFRSVITKTCACVSDHDPMCHFTTKSISVMQYVRRSRDLTQRRGAAPFSPLHPTVVHMVAQKSRTMSSISKTCEESGFACLDSTYTKSRLRSK